MNEAFEMATQELSCYSTKREREEENDFAFSLQKLNSRVVGILRGRRIELVPQPQGVERACPELRGQLAYTCE